MSNDIPGKTDTIENSLLAELRQKGRPKQKNSVRPSLSFWQYVPLPVAIICMIGVFFTYIMPWLNYILLIRQGISVPAIVTRLESSEEPASYRVFYQYTVVVNDRNTAFEGNSLVSWQLYKATQVGSQIKILYASSNPAVSIIESEMAPPSPLAALGWVALSTAFLLISLQPAKGERESQQTVQVLNSRGIQTPAVIFDRWTEVDAEGDTLYFTALGFTVQGQTVAFADQDKTFYETHQPGDTVMVRYLPEKPSVYQIL